MLFPSSLQKSQYENVLGFYFLDEIDLDFSTEFSPKVKFNIKKGQYFLHSQIIVLFLHCF